MNWGDCLFNNEVAQISCLEPLFGRIIAIVASLAGFIFLIMMVVGGLRYLFSGGNPKQAEAAKGTITSAFLGLVLVVGAFIILNIISSFTGLSGLTVFKILKID